MKTRLPNPIQKACHPGPNFETSHGSGSFDKVARKKIHVVKTEEQGHKKCMKSHIFKKTKEKQILSAFCTSKDPSSICLSKHSGSNCSLYFVFICETVVFSYM